MSFLNHFGCGGERAKNALPIVFCPPPKKLMERMTILFKLLLIIIMERFEPLFDSKYLLYDPYILMWYVCHWIKLLIPYFFLNSDILASSIHNHDLSRWSRKQSGLRWPVQPFCLIVPNCSELNLSGHLLIRSGTIQMFYGCFQSLLIIEAGENNDIFFEWLLTPHKHY